MPRAQIKDEKMHSELRSRSESKEKSARIAKAAAGSSRNKVGRKGGKSGAYDDWSKQDLGPPRDGSPHRSLELPSRLPRRPASSSDGPG
jgi:hypothetical protein